MATPRIGIIGAGLLGMRHADRWSRLPVKLEGFFDTDFKRAQQAADLYGCQIFRSADELARNVEIAHIASPTPFHKEGVLTAAAHGKHIFCEKPLARHPADAREIATACEKAGVRLYVGQTLRFFSQYAQAKKLIDEGKIGKAILIRLSRGAAHPTEVGERLWFKSVEKSGGAIMEGGIHDMDFARWCLGEIEQVFARGITFRDDLTIMGDHVIAILRFKNGAIGQIESSWMFSEGTLRQYFEIVGGDGILEYDNLPSEQLSLSLRANKRTSSLSLPPQGPLAMQDDPYYLQLEHFLACLQKDEGFRVSPQDGVEAVRLCHAAIKSMQTGKAIRVEEI